MSQPAPPLRACVIYDTRYGNTEKIAQALESGLTKAGIQTACASIGQAQVESLKDDDLIAIGAPTHYRTAPETMREFLERLTGAHLKGKYGFAFDTRRDHWLAGSAAGYIERGLKRLGLRMIAPRASAIIFTKTKAEIGDKKARRASAQLEEGEEKRFEQLGLEAGRRFSSR